MNHDTVLIALIPKIRENYLRINACCIQIARVLQGIMWSTNRGQATSIGRQNIVDQQNIQTEFRAYLRPSLTPQWKYFGGELSLVFDSFSLESFCTMSPSSVNVGIGENDNEVLRLQIKVELNGLEKSRIALIRIVQRIVQMSN